MFKRKIKYSDKEYRIKHIIENICKKQDINIKIDPKNLNMFISDEENHYDIVLLWNSIVIVNTAFSLRESFRTEFVEELKRIVSERASEYRQEVLRGILERESNMLIKMEETYA